MQIHFSGINFSIAIAAAVLFAPNMAVWSLLTSWVGSFLVAFAWSVRSRRGRAVPLGLPLPA